MDIVTVIFIAVGLAMDVFAVSITSGMTAEGSKVKVAVIMATSFAAFQMVMPLIGWGAASTLRDFITGVDHWIAFGLLAAIGCKMLYESMRRDEEERESRKLGLYVLLTLSIATSIDAFAVGASFAFLKSSIATPIVVIGAVTFMLSLVGTFIGNKTGHLLGNRAETLGGLILIGIGIRIVVEHTT
jgi:manganese efflux pump family protein